jgi:ribosome-binding ATPase
VGDVARKAMGDIPIAYVEEAGGVRVSEEEIVEVGRHDVRSRFEPSLICHFCGPR